MYIYDDEKDKEIAHIDFYAPVVRCFFKGDLYIILLPISTCRLVVALEKHTYIYTLPSMTLFAVYPTYSNPNGVCDVRIVESVPVIATLGEKRGSIRLIVIFLH